MTRCYSTRLQITLVPATTPPAQMSILPQSCLFVLIASSVVLITSPIINSLCAGERPGNPSPSSPHSLSGGP